ncbi:phage antirepressor protein [Roseibium sp. TrichSKD4]|uniref:phage antirepressor N-terminal domain-containing protein n=1 Tax=Roseibium sp. TrichSKD4 TaxID=744980 RepID=UPI0001E56386|nr:phage antirepressor N-terminal domain-containing protein [Roseibium sp. TrichSKD4]EFO33904.1 phage antirepressor protein [Roseibium sp. TrichSKD4]
MGKIITVNFRGDTLFGFEAEDGVYVALKPIVEAMGMKWEGQRQRVSRDPILSEGTCIMQVPFGRGGEQKTLCLKLELINGWLFTVDSNRIKDEHVRERVLTYQRECYAVLAEHFLQGSKPEREPVQVSGVPNSVRVRMVAETRRSFGCKQAQELWFKLNLPVVPSMHGSPDHADLFDFPVLTSSPT